MIKASVDSAVRVSDKTMSIFLLYLSAQTPANGDIKRVGKKPHIMDKVIIIPDWVFSVIYHVIAY